MYKTHTAPKRKIGLAYHPPMMGSAVLGGASLGGATLGGLVYGGASRKQSAARSMAAQHMSAAQEMVRQQTHGMPVSRAERGALLSHALAATYGHAAPTPKSQHAKMLKHERRMRELALLNAVSGHPYSNL